MLGKPARSALLLLVCALAIGDYVLLNFIVAPAYLRERAAARAVPPPSPSPAPVDRPADSSAPLPTPSAALPGAARPDAIPPTSPASAIPEPTAVATATATATTTSSAPSAPAPTVPAVIALASDAATPLAPSPELAGDLLFDFASAALSPAAERTLRGLALRMREDPALRIVLQGHTDTRGTEAYNIELSARRARVAADMLEADGIDPSRIEVRALGSTAPIDRGSTAAAFAKNRRVEVHLTTTGRTP